MPLSFIADTSGQDVINPEKAGFLLHEYFSLIFKQFPEYKSKKDLDFDDVLQRDVLKEKFDPYASDDVQRYMQSYSDWFVVGDRNSKKTESNSLKKGKKRDPRFELDPAEKEEYTRPTVPPISEIMDPKAIEGLGDDEEDVFNE